MWFTGGGERDGLVLRLESVDRGIGRVRPLGEGLTGRRLKAVSGGGVELDDCGSGKWMVLASFGDQAGEEALVWRASSWEAEWLRVEQLSSERADIKGSMVSVTAV